jgi:hypothetical protein
MHQIFLIFDARLESLNGSVPTLFVCYVLFFQIHHSYVLKAHVRSFYMNFILPLLYGNFEIKMYASILKRRRGRRDEGIKKGQSEVLISYTLIFPTEGMLYGKY